MDWEERARQAAKTHPLKILPSLPKMVGITPKTQRFLKWKSLLYLVLNDKTRIIPRYLLKKPFKYTFSFIKSCLKGKSYLRDDDFFLYGFKNVEEFKESLKKENSLFIVGFSYCHKPFECPSGRFTEKCCHDATHPVCQQCFIGRVVHLLPQQRTIPLWIPTIHYIGEKILEIGRKNPEKEIIFLITACELTLEMFGDWGNMAGVKGIGVRLDGRICNTMEAFKLSEEGIKPGLTVVLEKTQVRILDLIQEMSSAKGLRNA